MADMRKKILYLEDDEFTRLMVQSQLQTAGFFVESFATYTDVVTAVKEKNYDLIITDLHIDGHDPHDLVRNLKALRSLPVVILSGSEHQVDEADLSILKPFTPEKAKKIMGLLLNGSEDVDLSKVYQFACGDEGLVIDYVSTFISNYKTDLAALKADVRNGDEQAIKNRAHKMHSSVAYYNHLPLNELLQRLELNIDKMQQADLQAVLDKVEKHSLNLLSKVQQKIAV